MDVDGKKLKQLENNAWYKLATFHGDTASDQNRITWNRFMAARLTEKQRLDLVRASRHPESELVPLPKKKIQEIEKILLKHDPEWNRDLIDFSNTHLAGPIFFFGFLFTAKVDFDGAYGKEMSTIFFNEATFLNRLSFNNGEVNTLIFSNVTFHNPVTVENSKFQFIFFRKLFLYAGTFDKSTFYELSFDGSTFEMQSSLRKQW
jgi:hypothetical protein